MVLMIRCHNRSWASKLEHSELILDYFWRSYFSKGLSKHGKQSVEICVLNWRNCFILLLMENVNKYRKNVFFGHVILWLKGRENWSFKRSLKPCQDLFANFNVEAHLLFFVPWNLVFSVIDIEYLEFIRTEFSFYVAIGIKYSFNFS